MKTPSRMPPFVHICFPTSAKDDSRRSLHFAFLIKLLKPSAPSHSSRQLRVTDGLCVHTGFTWGKFSGSQTGEKRMPKESKPFRREKTRHDSETRSCCSSSVLLSGSGTPRPCASRSHGWRPAAPTTHGALGRGDGGGGLDALPVQGRPPGFRTAYITIHCYVEGLRSSAVCDLKASVQGGEMEKRPEEVCRQSCLCAD